MPNWILDTGCATEVHSRRGIPVQGFIQSSCTLLQPSYQKQTRSL